MVDYTKSTHPQPDETADLRRQVEELRGKVRGFREERDTLKIRSTNYADISHEWRKRAEKAEAKVEELRAERDEARTLVECYSEEQQKQLSDMKKAEAERDALAARVEGLETALEPFADIANLCDDFADVITFSDDDRINVVQAHGCLIETLSINDFIDARAALQPKEGEQ